MTVYQTRRLTVRRLAADDLDDLYKVYSDPIAARWVDDGEPITMDECKLWTDVTLKNYEVRGYGMFAITLRNSAEIIGFIGLVHPGNQLEPEVKYSFLRQHWGQGYATEAVRGALIYGREMHALDCIIATVAPENLASQRVLEKADMQRGELLREDDGSYTRVYRWHQDSTSGPAS